MSDCATPEVLADLIAGKLSAIQTEAVREHLAGCSLCLAVLDGLTDHPELSRWAVGAAGLTPLPPDTPPLHVLLDELRQTPASCAPYAADRDGDSRRFLSAPNEDGDLGTLGRYRVLAEIGRGGMGIVLKGYDPTLARHVALKLLRRERADQRARERFVREARAAAGIDHDHVVAIFSVENPPDGPPYLVMPYILGPTLRQRIRSDRRLDAREAARICAEVADGLAAAHAAGLIHRDIKPANIILDSDHGRAKIVDFGLVRVQESASDTTQDGAIPGTPEYMSPEQIREPALVDGRSDVYGLGVALYEALTGEVPFRGAPHMVMQQVLHDDPVPPRRLRDHIPHDLQTICLKAMAKEPGRRYQSAIDLRDDLRRWMNAVPIRARPIGPAERVGRWCRRNPVTAGLLSSVALLLAVIAIGAELHAQRLTVARDDVAKKHQTAMDNLREAYLAQAQALRSSGRAGRRFQSLEVLQKAAQIRPGLDLRNEAVASLPLVDLKVSRQWHESSSWVFDANLERYARSDAEGAISIRRVADDTEVAALPGAAAETHSMSFSPDGRLLAAVYRSGGFPVRIQVFDLETSTAVLKLEIATGIRDIGGPAFNPDCRRIAINKGDGFVCIHALPTGEETHRWFCGGKGAVSMCFHPSEPKLALNRWWDPNLEIVAADSGEVLTTIKHTGTINGFSWRPDGRCLAAGCADRTVRIWNTMTGELQKVLEGHQAQAFNVVYNHAGDLLASYGWDVTTRLWNPISGMQYVSIPGCMTHFSRDDRRLAYHLADAGQEVGIWDVAAGADCRTLYSQGKESDEHWDVDVHPHGRLVASASGAGIHLWDPVAHRELAMLPIGPCESVRFDPEGTSLISSGEHGIQRWPIASETDIGRVRVGPPQSVIPSLPAKTGCIRICRDGSKLAVVAGPAQAIVLDLKNPADRVELNGHRGIHWLDISPDGRWVATGAKHGSGIKVWDARDGRVVQELAADNYGHTFFTPDGKWLLTNSKGREPERWAVGDWRRDPLPERLSATQLGFRAAFTSDGQVLAATSGHDQVTLADAATGRELARLTSPNPLPISGLCFSPDDGALVASCANHHAIQIWDLRDVRQQLAAMNLAGGWPQYPRSPATPPVQPLKVEVLLTAP
jgi:eukaryotic-like serine/threonine-protein kinase